MTTQDDRTDDPTAGRSDAEGGTYSLVLAVASPTTVEVGALGTRSFEPGPYVYTGSACGPGGFARVERHRELAAGDRTARHWHVDALLTAPAVTIDGVWTSPGVARECAIAGSVPGEPIAGVGASDCSCVAHLVAGTDRDAVATTLDDRHERRGTP